MCNNSFITWYLLLVILIPLIYIISFILWKNEHKNYKRMLVVSIILLLIFLSIYSIIYLLIPKKNCNKNTTTATTKESTTTITTTTQNINIKYKKLDVIDGEKIDKGKTSKGFDIYTIDGVYYVNGYMIANKTYPLPSTYYPKDTYNDASNVSNTCNDCIVKAVWDAYQDMKNDANDLGLYIVNNSGYRSYETQEYLWNRYASNDGKEKADTYSSRAGHSDHQTGLAFDLNSIEDSFADTKEGKWINDNCYKYGFILRFPKGKQDETGYKYESWHLRYVGEELATKLYNNGDWRSMEEYFGITSSYDDIEN